MLQRTAIRYLQGRRDVYLFSLTLAEIDQLLPSRSDDNLNTIQDANRALAPRHAGNIRRYLAETDDWVLGAITLAISPEAVRYEEQTLTVGDDHEHPLRIIDGQHRRRAIANLLADAPSLEEYADQSLAVCSTPRASSATSGRCSPVWPSRSPSTKPPGWSSTPPTRSTTPPAGQRSM